MRRLLSLFAVAFACLASNAFASDVSPIVQADERIGGRSLADWEVAWSKWSFGFTNSELGEKTGCLPQPSSAPVHFLVIPESDDDVNAIPCTVPAGSYLLLGEPQIYCTDIDPEPAYPTTAKGLARCARHYWHQLTDPHPRVVLDGQPIPNGYVVHTRAFRFRLPPRDNMFDLPGVRRGRAAVVARVTLLRPAGSR